jgi:hypothetical protein
MDRYEYLLKKKSEGSLTNEESDELFDLESEENEEYMTETEKVGMIQTPWGWM